ncbi:glucosylceramidase [Flavihumibacter rivuli]|uniref:glycoside hydrolase family 30 protein n=1 Tax=Flavihumibacter rivuli TaxID=2838156 RepID=UPI001BDE3C51|nr:glycoside hydrolase family 30 beta sandwich domain-containing protein [Flavihumibacter rivuli]ULQ56021.1 glucosylceramidase [Flavihumibacter rivuli]
MKHRLAALLFSSTVFFSCYAGCSKDGSPGEPDPLPNAVKVSSWLTRADQSALLQQQPVIAFSDKKGSGQLINVDSATIFQGIDGFGYTLTGGSAYLINRMPEAEKNSLLQELFGKAGNSIGVSYLRLSIGASDLSAEVFSYNDLPAGQVDPELKHFSLAQDTVDLIPLLKKILAINPDITLMASPWSPPVWMKDNGKSVGGGLLPQYYGTYANYFVKYIQAMKAQGITIHAITPQNEPLHGGNNPSLVMTPAQQADFIGNHLGPAFKAAGITTKIIIYDHNLDRPDYPITVLNDSKAKPFIDGSAFHLYAGDVSAMSTVRNAHPDRNLYFTEQWTGSRGTFDGDLQWHTKNVIIGTVRNWSRIALEWNLANDPTFGPHTPGGCTECRGALTVTPAGVARNVSYYIIAHASKFVPAGSKRIASDLNGTLPNVAFLTPDGRKVMIVLNESSRSAELSIGYKGKYASISQAPASVATYVW